MTPRILSAAIGLLMASVTVSAADDFKPSSPKRDPFNVDRSDLSERVIVGNDTIPIVIPDVNYGRYDRGLFNYLYIPRHQWRYAVTASYGEFSADDVQVLSDLRDINFKGKMYAIRPSVSWFFANNQSIGLRFDITHAQADLGSLTLDFIDDLSFSLHDVRYHSTTYSVGAFYRHYVGLNRARRFAVFNEVELKLGGGHSQFSRYYDSELRDTRTDIFEAALQFSPGVCMFITQNVSFNISFGVFGLNFRNEKQKTNGEDEGSRFSSGANFKFNIFNINFGLGVNI